MMGKISHEEARGLMDKFLDGATSNAEEKRLHDYFGQGDVADDLAQLATMMEWYADLEKGEPSASMTRKRPQVMRWIMLVSAAAAGLALLVTTAVGRFGSDEEEFDDTMLEMYSGSYIVRGGKKVTDIKKVLPTILESERMATKMRIEARSEFAKIQEEMQQRLWEECDSIVSRSMAVEETGDY